MDSGWFRKGLMLALCGFVPAGTLGYEKEIKSTAATMAEGIAKSAKKTIAVVDFTDLQGNVTELGRFLAEEFSVALAGTGKGFEVVDRTHLKAILAEHKLASTGVIDPATARKLGQIAGVETLVTGTITPFGDSVRLAVKGLDTATAKIILAAATDIPKTKAIEELLAKGIQPGFQPPAVVSPVQAATPSLPTPAKPAAGSAAPAPVAKARFKQLSFELVSCDARGTRVTCGVMVTSAEVGGSRSLYLYAAKLNPTSRAIDESGNQYLATRISLGSESGDRDVRTELAPEVPIRATFLFEEVPADVRSFAILALAGGWAPEYGIESFQVALRRVPISR